MLKASFKKHVFQFKRPGGTSRGVLSTKDSWYLIIFDSEQPGIKGIGECSIIKGLSIDDRPDFEQKLQAVIRNIGKHKHWLNAGLDDFPSIRFGLEMALSDLANGGSKILYPSLFTNHMKGIPINGLVWMGAFDFMREQIVEKINTGFRCIKLKIGAINFDDELSLLKMIRKEFNEDELELRVDANGAFQADEALEKLKRLSEYRLHSIEQPVRQGQWVEMAKLCYETPLPIALDEELIGIKKQDEIRKMLETIKPQYIILKPSLVGGWLQSGQFIEEAEKLGISWWVTSALEGNIGLNAISQWTATLNNPMPQGLGTGQLFTNNIPSPLFIENAELFFNIRNYWDLNSIIDE